MYNANCLVGIRIVVTVITYVQFNGETVNYSEYCTACKTDDLQVFSSIDCTGSTADSGLYHF